MIIQGIAQVVALTVLRRVQPDLERPFGPVPQASASA